MTAYRIDVEIIAPVMETEVPERVADAIHELFPGAEIESGEGELRGRTHALQHFSDRLHDQEILDTARRTFVENLQGNRFTFDLKKQAAFQGVVNFAVGSPSELGNIHVRVTVEEHDIERVIETIAPPTEDGRPIGETDRI